MSEGGEARNHETGIEAAIEAAMPTARPGTTKGELLMILLPAIPAYLDAVRCAQGCDTDAPEGSSQEERCTTADCGRIATWEAFVDDAEPPMWHPYCKACAGLLNDIYDARPLAARSPQGEDHEAALVAHAIEEALPFAVEARTSERAAETVLSVLAADRAGEIDRLRAGISFVRGLCTDRASYSVIDERLGELLDGETK